MARSFRFQKFTTVYPAFARQFVDRNPDHEQLSFHELYRSFTSTLYGLSDFYAVHLRQLGHETQDLFASLEPLQKAWAREKGAVFREQSWLADIVLAQVRDFRPDVLFLQDLSPFEPAFRRQLRDACPKGALVVGWIGSPVTDLESFRDLDLVLTCVPGFVERLRKAGVKAELLALGFEPSILSSVKPREERDLCFTFVGSMINSTGFHSRRYGLIQRLMETTPLEVWGEISSPWSSSRKPGPADGMVFHTNRFLAALGVAADTRAGIPFLRRGAYWVSHPALPPLNERFPGRFHAPLFGREYYGLLARSQIAFNSHIDFAGQDAGNVRLFEATGMGACLLTDWKANLLNLFQPDVEVVVYRDGEEAIEKTVDLLEHPEKRKAIAAAGQRRTLAEHSYSRRAEQLVDILSHCARRGAPQR